MKKLNLLSISVSLAITFMVANLSPIGAQNAQSSTDFLNNWTTEFNKKLPMRIGEVMLVKATSNCPDGCQGETSDHYIRIQSRNIYTFDHSYWKQWESQMKSYLRGEYCRSGASQKGIELLNVTDDQDNDRMESWIKPSECPTTTPPKSSGSDSLEEQFWKLVKDSKQADDFETYIANYPIGKYVAIARLRKSQLSGQNNATSKTAPTGFLQYGLATSNQTNLQYMRSWAAQTKSQLPLKFGDVEIYDLYGPSKDENYFYIIGWTPRLSSPVDTRSQSAALKAKFLSEYCRSVAYRRQITLAIWVSDNNKKNNFGSMLTPRDCSVKQPAGNSNGGESDSQASRKQTNVQYLNSWAAEVRVGLPEIIGEYFKLTDSRSRCPAGCDESDSVPYLLLSLNAHSYTKQEVTIAGVERSLKPVLLQEYCTSEGKQRNIMLGVFVNDKNSSTIGNFWVYPKDCPTN